MIRLSKSLLWIIATFGCITTHGQGMMNDCVASGRPYRVAEKSTLIAYFGNSTGYFTFLKAFSHAVLSAIRYGRPPGLRHNPSIEQFLCVKLSFSETHKLQGRLLCMDNSAVPEGTLADFFQYVEYEPDPSHLEVSYMKVKNVTIGPNGAFDIIVPTRRDSSGRIVRVSAIALRSDKCKQGKHLNRGIVTNLEQVDQDLGTIVLNS